MEHIKDHKIVQRSSLVVSYLKIFLPRDDQTFILLLKLRTFRLSRIIVSDSSTWKWRRLRDRKFLMGGKKPPQTACNWCLPSFIFNEGIIACQLIMIRSENKLKQCYVELRHTL